MPYFLETDELWFPPVELADEEGLLMIGGDLSVERLLLAYRSGIFPWFEEQGYPFWFSPDPRLVLFPQEVYISHSMKQLIRSQRYQVTFNMAFEKVIRNCAAIPRKNQSGTWISDDFIEAYVALHQAGHAKSVEVWQESGLIGGLYGVEVNGVLSGESMFSILPNASKLALVWLCKSGLYRFIDCQVGTEHLQRMGARHIPRQKFLALLQQP